MDIDEQFIGSRPPQWCHEMHLGNPRSKSRLVHREHQTKHHPETMIESTLKSEDSDSMGPLVNKHNYGKSPFLMGK